MFSAIFRQYMKGPLITFKYIIFLARMSTVKLIETEEKLSKLERTSANKDEEIERVRRGEQTALNKLSEVNEENALLKKELDQCRRIINERGDSKVKFSCLIITLIIKVARKNDARILSHCFEQISNLVRILYAADGDHEKHPRKL